MRLRLLLAFSLLICITLLGVSLFIRQNTAKQIQQFVNRGGAIGAENLVEALEEYYQEADSWEGVEALLRTGQGEGSGKGNGGAGVGRTLRLADASGNLIFDPSDEGTDTVLAQDELNLGIELILENNVVGYLLPQSGISFSGGSFEQSLITHLDSALWNAALVSGFAALILAFILAGLLMKPIRELTMAASQMAKGNLDQEVPEQGAVEIKTLAATFNQMAFSLQQLEQARQAMTADIAHELRTPLAVQRINLEALQDGVYPMSIDSLQPIADQNQLLIHLVEDLRTLSLAEAGELTLDRNNFDLPPLINGLVKQFDQQAVQKQIRIQAPLSPFSCRVYADKVRVTQILSNLLQNAMRYTPSGSQVFISLSSDHKMASIVVRDTGSGISEDALPYIFERFYKADRSRSRAEGGSGLGLAIARQLAELNNGSLTAANHPDGGAAFTLKIPLA